MPQGEGGIACEVGTGIVFCMGEGLLSMLSGAASIITIWPATRIEIQRPISLRTTDAQRLSSDWKRVGQHLQIAMTKVQAEHGKAK